MSRPASGAVLISIRIPQEALDEAAELAKAIERSGSGFASTRSDVLRAALFRGLALLRAELAPSRSSRKKR